ncbi:MAG TPA: HEAT repeat domain-containing protein, partial [Acidobacteriota bacterium]|nr:HEAT repeat domain-containing protein [Acidobacteriota bacterium]
MAKADLIKSFQDGSAPKELRLVAARGLTALPPRETLNLLAQLAKDPDPEVASQAAQTLKSLPEEEILSHVQAKDCEASILEHFATAGASDAILEALALNPATPGTAVAQLASTAAAPLLELILYNRVRLLECPAIIESARLNPSISGEGRRLIQEIEQEFFGSKKKEYTVGDEAETSEAAPAAESFVSFEVEAVPEDLALEGLPLDPEERESAILDKLSKMTVPEKIKHALVGTR